MELLLIGRIARAHGVRGECKMVPEAADCARYGNLERVFLGRSAQEAAGYTVESIREHVTSRGRSLLIRFARVDSPERAGALSGLDVYADREDLPPLDAGEYYLHDLVGLQVTTPGDEVLGTMKDVYSAPASDIFVVARPGRKDALIPAVPAFVEGVDVDEGRVIVRPIEGMLD